MDLSRCWSRIMAALALVTGIGSTPAPAAAQEHMLTERAPRFLLASNTPRTPPVAVDVSRSAMLRRVVSLRVDRPTVGRLLDAIQRETGLRFYYGRDVVSPDQPVSLRADSITVAAALVSILMDTGVDVLFTPNGQAALVKRAIVTAAEEAQATVTGRIVSADGGGPIGDAQVTVQGTRLGATTDAEGRFRIAGVSGAQVVLQARRLGYRPARQTVVVGSGDVVITLTAAPMVLEGVVVTGTPGEAQKRSLGNSIAQIDAVLASEFVPPGNVERLLIGRAPGVNVNLSSGRLGAGASISIRGRGTLSLNDQPLIYIDGARAANDVGTGPGQQGGNAVSRLNDVNPEDIESIEVIKGPAAATLYGTEASNGVIQIITKKGKPGRSIWNLSVQQGANWITNPSERIGNSYGPSIDANGNVSLVTMNLVDSAAASGWPLFTTGHLQRYGLSLGGGSDRFQYFASSNLTRDQGADPVNTLNSITGNANLKVVASDKIDVTSSINYLSSQTNLTMEEGRSALYSILFGGPIKKILMPQGNGFRFGPPQIWYEDNPYQNTQDVTKFTGSVTLNHRPASWLQHRLTVGVDQTNEYNQTLVPFMAPHVAVHFPGGTEKGSVWVIQRDLTYTSADYSASGHLRLASSLMATTSVGGQFYRRQVTTLQSRGFDFPGPGASTVSATARDRITEHALLTTSTLGMYVQEQLAWRNRLFLTGAVRIDNNSAFGSDFDLVTYPKLSGSWVVSEEPFWKLGFVSALKLRAAYGQSGQAPTALTALRTYTPTTGPNDAPAVIPGSYGNPDLKPERGSELEAGFEASLFDRVAVEFTYFTRRTKDAILQRSMAPSGGFTGAQFVNIGEVKNHGIELAVNANLVNSRRLSLDLGVTLATANDEVVSMGDLGTLTLFASGGQLLREGYPIGGYFQRRVVSADIVPRPNASPTQTPMMPANVLCDGGPDAAPVPCAGAPAQFIGSPTPKQLGALTTTVTLFGNLQLYAMVDYKRGHYNLNSDPVFRCGADLVCEAMWYPERYDPTYVAEAHLGSSGNIRSRFVEKADFARLRELSASYTLPSGWVRSLGASRAVVTVAGRNLHTWTGYTGLDPETHVQTSNSVQFAQAQIPVAAQLITSIRLTF